MKRSIILSNNENTWGCSPCVLHALQQSLNQVHRYPDHQYDVFRATLSKFLQVEKDQVVVGNGSEHILEMIVKCFVQRHQNVIISQYAFQTIPFILKNYRIKTKTIPLLNWHDNIQQMIDEVDSETRLIFLVNPNNPVGSYTNKTQFEYLMNSVPPSTLVVVDEAYFEYVKLADYPDAISYLPHYPNLISTRTFSKIYGLAGMRIGYAVASPFLAAQLNATRLPYHVNRLAIAAALAALSDQDHINMIRQVTHEGYQLLTNGLTKLGYAFLPSKGNFVTVKVHDSHYYCEQLHKVGLIVKSLEAYGLNDYIRISIGTSAHIQHLLAAFDQLMINSLMVK